MNLSMSMYNPSGCGLKSSCGKLTSFIPRSYFHILDFATLLSREAYAKYFPLNLNVKNQLGDISVIFLKQVFHLTETKNFQELYWC